MKKSLSVVIALLVIMSMLLVSCSGSAPAPAAAPAGESQAAAGSEAAGGPVQIRIFSPQAPEGDLTTNSFTKEAEEMFNIRFEWQVTPFDGNSAKEQRQISLASGDYPDLYMLIPWIDQFSQLD